MEQSREKGPDDFIVCQLLGEDSDSTVVLGTEVSCGGKFAIKILEKNKLENSTKIQQIKKEQKIIQLLDHPFFVKLHWSFEDEKRLYFVLSFATNGDLLSLIEANNYLPVKCAKFYAAELLTALEYLFKVKIIHRDLKPENILLTENMHIQITDFGTAKYCHDKSHCESDEGKTMSFVGTADYVPPELLTQKSSNCSSDLWSMGCIIFQMLTGKTPFHDTNEYRVFEKIIKCSYEIPSSVENDASHLIQSLLKTDPSSRLGSKETGGFDELRNHPFFDVINWKNLSDQEPPRIAKRILTLDDDGYATFRQKKGIQRLQCSDPDDVDGYGLSITMSDEERLRRLDLQTKTKWDSYSTGGLILKQGALQKKRGLSLKVRYFLLTDTPKLVYIDPDTMELKGEIPWSDKMQTEVKTFKVFFIHVPGRTYHLIDKTGNAIKWCKKIEEVKEHFMTHPE